MSKRRISWLSLLLALLVAVICLEPTHILRGFLRNESFFRGRPTSYWSERIRARMQAGPQEPPPTSQQSASLLDKIKQAFAPSRELALEPKFDEDPDPRAVPVLIELLNDDNHQVRFFACNALVGFGARASGAVPALRKMLRDEDIYCRRNAVNVLAGVGPDAGSAVPELIQALEDDDLWVNYFAAVALGKIGKGAQEAVPGLVKLYKSEKASVSYLGPGNEDRFLNPGIDRIGQVAVLALNEIDPEAAKKAGIR